MGSGECCRGYGIGCGNGLMGERMEGWGDVVG